jgi:hypothetical protein
MKRYTGWSLHRDRSKIAAGSEDEVLEMLRGVPHSELDRYSVRNGGMEYSYLEIKGMMARGDTLSED